MRELTSKETVVCRELELVARGESAFRGQRGPVCQKGELLLMAGTTRSFLRFWRLAVPLLIYSRVHLPPWASR